MTYEVEQLNREQSFSETDRFSEDRYRQFGRHLGAGFSGRVLDVGCNVGRGGLAFAGVAPGAILDGVELVPERLQQIPAGTYRQLHAGLLEDVPPDAGPYDALLLGELIEHVPFDALDRLIVSVQRLLAPGGRLLLTTPNPHYFLLKRRSRGSVLGGAHVSVHCPAALAQYLMFKGFTVTEVTGSGKMSRKLGERFPLWVYGSYLLIAQNG